MSEEDTRTAPRLDGLNARTPAATRFAAAARHRRNVMRLRVVLPVLALVCIAAVFISLIANQREDVHVAGSEIPGIEMHAPVLKGTGENGKPYQVAATDAVQSHDGTVALTNVDATVELQDGTMTLTARQGSLHQKTGDTTVDGGVVIELGGIYRFVTEHAEGNMKTGIFTGDQPVRVEGPMGTIDAAGFKIEKSVKRVTFTGGVQSVIEPDKVKDAPKPGSKPAPTEKTP